MESAVTFGTSLCKLVPFFIILKLAPGAEEDQVFTQCGGKFTSSKGVIHSPNYPNPFPTPIYCEWVINAPSDKKIVLYFTQFYLRGSFDVLEYVHYSDFTTYIDERKLATVNCEDEIPFIVSYRPYLVLRFAVHEMGNIHMRVLDHIVDVFGFNITYEFAPKASDYIKPACSVHYCSYLGNCIADADFSTYKCHCFPGYFGEECKYGPHCDPPRGENMCFNGGKCRYFLGTYVNTCECPKGYDGSRCEIQTDVFLPDYCVSLGCDQRCEKGASGGHCSCYHGYRLTANNRTCIHIDRYRVTVSVSPTSQYLDTVRDGFGNYLITENMTTDLQLDVFTKLSEIGILSADKFGALGLRNSSRGLEYRFYFYIERSDLKYLRDGVDYLSFIGKLGSMNITSTLRPKYTTEPELYLVSVSTSTGDSDLYAAVQGRVLTLSCAARGSQNIKFEWFKDGHVINTSLTNREVYVTVVPSSSDELIRSILSFDSVSPYDRGEYTCRASDYGESENKSVIVDVITLPLVDLDPLSSSVNAGDKVSVRCMSPDDTQKTFINEWFEGSNKIIPGRRKDRIVEDLFPTGTRLFIPSLTHSGTFTCRVTNAAGGVNVTAHIYVPEANETNLECSREYYKQVMWRRTAGKHFDKQRCPTDTGGYATRKCNCLPGADFCQWEEPNFVRCQSFHLTKIYDELEMLRLGYQHMTMKTVYDHLNEFIQRSKEKLYSGDIEIATSILAELLQHLQSFPALATKDEPITLVSVLGLIDDLMTGAMNATTEEKQMMNAGMAFLKMSKTIAVGLSDVLEFSEETETSFNFLDVNIKSTYLLQEDGAHHYYPRLAFDRNKRKAAYDNVDTKNLQVMEFIYRNLLSFLKEKNRNSGFSTMESVSSIHSLYPLLNETVTIMDDNTLSMDIPIPHMKEVNLDDVNETLCLEWEFDLSDSNKGRWLKDSCSLLRFESSYSLCRCPIPGYFMVAVIPYKHTAPILKGDAAVFLYIKIGCITMMCGVVATLIILVCNWRKLRSDDFGIHLNFLLPLIGVNIVFLICLKNEDNEVICIAGKILLHFLYLAAETFIFVESIHLYVIATKRQPTRYRLAKYLSIGWGIPALMTILVLITSTFIGHSSNCGKVCWVTRDHWQFYGYVVPMTILALSYLAFICLSLKTCLTWKEEWRISTKQMILSSSLKSGIILLLLIASSLLSTSLNSHEQEGQLIVLMCTKIILAIVIFASNIIFEKRIFLLLWTKSKGAKRKSSSTINGVSKDIMTTSDVGQENTLPSSSSFRAFIKPERVEEDARQEQESVSKYYEEINRLTFTKERKRHLSTLLGSSTSGILMNSIVGSYTFRQQDVDSDHNGTDSGIFVGSEQDRSERYQYPFEDSEESGIQILLPSKDSKNGKVRGHIKQFLSDSDDVFEDLPQKEKSKTCDVIVKVNENSKGKNGCVIPVLVKSGDNRRHNPSDMKDMEESSALIHSTKHHPETNI